MRRPRHVRLPGYDLLRRDYYSPIPDPRIVGDGRIDMVEVALDLDRSVEHVRELERFLREFVPPDGWRWDNGLYGRVEADLLYAELRFRRPARIIELGSGHSSLIIAAAARANAADGVAPHYTAVDPYPRDFVRAGIAGLDELRDQSATAVPLAEFENLGDNDVLFVDTTHTVKPGSEVNHLILEVLPRLAPGVVVHFHDVVLPYEYPRAFFEKGLFWAEQYLLHAFLAMNDGYEVLLPAYALCRERAEAMAGLVGSFRPGVGPGAFWIRRRG